MDVTMVNVPTFSAKLIARLHVLVHVVFNKATQVVDMTQYTTVRS